jgi:hypothetical protein
MDAEEEKTLLERFKQKFDTLPAGTVLAPPTEADDDVKSVKFGDPEMMGFCAVCGTAPCRADDLDNIAYFGVCPRCHSLDGHINVGQNADDPGLGKVNVGLCRAHKTCWTIGYKILSSFYDETVEQQKALQAALGFWTDYQVVEPKYASKGAFEDANEAGCTAIPIRHITMDDLK